MLTPDEHKRARFQGQAYAAAALAGLVRNGLPVEGVESYAAGMVDGARAFLLAYVSERAAYELLQRAADRIPAGKGDLVGEWQP